MSKIYVDEIHPKTTGGTTSIIKPSSGSILQVQYTQFTGTNAINIAGNTDTKLTDLTVNITPTSTNSIIKIEAMVNGEWGENSAVYNSVWFFYRDNTKLAAPVEGSRTTGILMGTFRTYNGADAGSTPEMAVYSYFDTPNTTSQITYSVGLRHGLSATYGWRLNKTVADANTTDSERGISLITVTEIAG